MPLLFSNRFARLDLEQSIVRYTRNGEAFASLDELTHSHGEVARALDRLGRARYSLLVDLREARAANTQAAEHAMMYERKRLLTGFNRVAVLVKSAAGVLQVQRHAREDEITLRVFLDDERSALAYLRGAGPISEREPQPHSGVVERDPWSERPLGAKLVR